MKTRFLTAALALGLAAAALAQAPAREAAPAPGPARPFTLPQPQRFTLDNGLRVTLVPYGSVPKTLVRLAVRSGNAFETKDEVWLADLSGKLMREATKTRDATALSTEAARMGGTLDVNVGEDQTLIGGEVLSEFAPDMVGLVADVAQQPTFPESELAGEVLSEFAPDMVGLVADVAQQPTFPESELARLKADFARQLSLQRSQPQPLAQEAFRKALYGDHPYGRMFPTPEQLQGYTAAQARAFWERNSGAARSQLLVVGRFDAAAVEKAVRAAFAAMPRGTPASPVAPSPHSERRVHLVDRPGAVQSTLVVGLPVVRPDDPDWVPLQVTHTLLGGYFSSRITANIREQKGYTYSPFAQLSTRVRDAYWAENADVTTAVTGASLKEIFAEIDRLQAEPPPAAELRAVQNYLGGTFVLQNSTRGGIVNQLLYVDNQGLGEEYLRTYVAKVNAVTPAQVSEMARKHLRDDQMTIAVVGDRKVVEEQLKPFGPLAP
jgi:zinc protease